MVPRRAGHRRDRWPIPRRGAPPPGDRADLAGGPHGARKGAGICHGTAGNRYALLAAFARTGDEQWLERACRFATHALAQAERETPVYSLFPGGVGVALFASDCLDAECRYPLLG